jgi:DNA repair ATPase RecN
VLTGFDISNYQSHRRTRVQVGQLTVITGQSDVGKSSLFRAGQLVAQNASGTGYIRRGAKSCAVILRGQDTETGVPWVVGIERTSTGGGRYRLKIGDGPAEEFTKLGGKVPEQVARVLRLGELNFAGQLAQPFLVASTGTEIARVLGELTNVSMLFRAAAEAGRVRKRAEHDQKNAEGRLEQLQERSREFDDLPGQEAAIGQAEVAAARVAILAKDLDRLQSLILRYETEAEHLTGAQLAAAAAAPPDLTRLEAGLAKYTRLCQLIEAYDAAVVGEEQWSAAATLALEREKAAHKALHAAQESIGICPLCGRGADAA